MIITVTLNAAVDKTYRIEHFVLDRVHRPAESRTVAGGKGINVARVYQALGGRAMTTGFLGGYNGRFIARALGKEGIHSRFVRTREESRVCIAVVDPSNGTQTEVNENGPRIATRELSAFRALYADLLRQERPACCVLSGSAPPGVPDTIYADLINIARECNVRCVLDASGAPLAAGLRAVPWMAKPNIHELSEWCGEEVRDRKRIVQIADGILQTGVEIVVVTMGQDGCICVTRDESWFASPPVVRFVSAVGSGDSLVGAMLWAMAKGESLAESLRMGVAAGAANATVYGAGFCTRRQIDEAARGVNLERLSGVEEGDRVRSTAVY